jgi:HlyD family secretion protein
MHRMAPDRTLPGWAALLLLAACGHSGDPSAILATGHVEATEIHVATKLGGTLQWFTLQEGDTVIAGQVVARMDTVDVGLALAGARADRDQVDADLRLRLAGARTEDIAEAQTQVDRAQADLTGAQSDLSRMQGLLDLGSGAVKARDDARTRRDVAAASLAGAQERLRKLRSLSRPQEIDGARARLAATHARVDQLRQQLTDAVVHSPRAGIVTAKTVEQGELVAPGATLAVITDLHDAWLTAYVGELDLARLRVGQPAQVRTDDGQTRQGTVTAIASQAEFTPKNVQTREERVKLVYRVKIALHNEDGLFKPGMPAEAVLHAATGTGAKP